MPADFSHEDVRRFEIAVNDRLLVRVLNTLTHLNEEIQTLADAERMAVTVLGDGSAGHVLHHEERRARRRRSSVEHLGDGRMIHQRQRLTLRFESEDRFAPDEFRFQEFQRDAATHRFGLLGQPDFTHPAFSNPIQELVTTNDNRRGVCRIRRDRCS